MFILIAPYTFDPAQIEAFRQYADAAYLPWVQQQPGFQSLSGGLDRAGGRGVAHYVFDTREQIDTFLAQYEATWRSRFLAVGADSDAATLEIYEYSPPVTAAG